MEKDIKEMIKLAKSGEKPGKSVYVCKLCGKMIVIRDKDETLPPCPGCGGENYNP